MESSGREGSTAVLGAAPRAPRGDRRLLRGEVLYCMQGFRRQKVKAVRGTGTGKVTVSGVFKNGGGVALRCGGLWLVLGTLKFPT